MVIYNGNPEKSTYKLPEGKWNLVVNGQKAGTEVIEVVEGTIELEPLSAYVLYRE